MRTCGSLSSLTSYLFQPSPAGGYDSISISEYPLQSSNLGLNGFNRNLFQFAVFRFLLYPIFFGGRWHTHGVKCLISGSDDARLTRAGMSEGMRYPIQQTSAEGFFASAQGMSFLMKDKMLSMCYVEGLSCNLPFVEAMKQKILGLALFAFLVVGISSEVIHLNRQKSPSFSLKRELISVYSGSFMSKLTKIIKNTKANVGDLNGTGMFVNDYVPVKQDNELWNKVGLKLILNLLNLLGRVFSICQFCF